MHLMNQTFSQSEKNRPLSASADPELERELATVLRQMHDEISTNSGIPHLSAVVLGGSYGRGEGGCVRDQDGRSHPHNDLDFFVFTSGARKREQRRINAALAEIGRRYARTLGIDVDFAPAREEKTLSCVSRTLMFQELRRGYRILYGTNAFLKYLPRLPFEKLPAAETLRLLMNRGVGLLLALQKSISSPGEEEFIRRNHAKAVLGCGDALLLASGRYSASARDRRASMAAWAAEPGAPAMLRDFAPVYERTAEWKLQVREQPVSSFDPALLREAVHQWQNTLICVIQLYSGSKAGQIETCLYEIGKNPLFQSGRRWKNGIFSLLYFRRGYTQIGFFSSPRLKVLEQLTRFLEEIDRQGTSSSAECFFSPDFCAMIKRWRRFS